MDEVPSFDGYTLGRQLADGSWLARESRSRASVVLRVVAAGGDAERERLRARLAACGALGHEHLLAPRAVYDEPERVVVVHDPVPRGTLDDLLAARGGLSPGEIVTLAVPLAQALGALHAAGTTYGELPTTAVGFDADGRPMLLPPASGRPADASGDLERLAGLCSRSLDAEPPEALAAALTAAERGGTPYSFAAECAAAVAPAPVRFDRGGDADGADRGRARFPRGVPRPAPRLRRWAAPAGAVAIAGVAVLAGLVWGGASTPPATHLPVAGHSSPAGPRERQSSAPHANGSPGKTAPHDGEPAASPGATTSPSRRAGAGKRTPDNAGGNIDWSAMVTRLAARRANAFAAADPALLAAAEALGSPLYAADTATVRTLRRHGWHAAGLHRDVRRALRRSRGAHMVTLRVVDALSAYAIVEADGTVVRRTPARKVGRFTTTLRRVGGTWKLADVQPAGR
jgi:hypothetical protein